MARPEDAPELIAPSPFDASYPPALAIYCSDGRFTQSVEELLHALGHARIDTLTIPGGPALFNRRAGLFCDHDAIARGTALLVTSHATTRVVLLAHHGCGYYKQRYPTHAEGDRYTLQLEDLRVARTALLAEHPRLDVIAYFAVPSGGRVSFRRVPLG